MNLRKRDANKRNKSLPLWIFSNRTYIRHYLFLFKQKLRHWLNSNNNKNELDNLKRIYFYRILHATAIHLVNQYAYYVAANGFIALEWTRPSACQTAIPGDRPFELCARARLRVCIQSLNEIYVWNARSTHTNVSLNFECILGLRHLFTIMFHPISIDVSK